jgi:hypothetical protein
MSRFNTSSTHPLIPNSQKYMYEQKYVSIHSQDRDYIHYPNSSEFEITLPQDYCNIETIRLIDWSFPANYDVFSSRKNNIFMTFQITKPYNPGEHNVNNPLLEAIFAALYENIDFNYPVFIEQGFYGPYDIATELTNRFNSSVSDVIINYLNKSDLDNKKELLDLFILGGGYTQFVVAYNSVGQKLWFGNKSSDFVLKNSKINKITTITGTLQCEESTLPSFSNWGLPEYLGFSRCDATTNSSAISQNKFLSNYTGLPRFYYGDYKIGDNGYWLVPDLIYKTNTVYYLEAPKKINLMGDAYFYLEISGLNNLDETSPWSLSKYTLQTNGTNGVVNSAFAKIAVPTTPISQWFDADATSYKWFNPPAERIRKLKIKLRYHDNSLVDFGDFDYSITLEFGIFNPQIARKAELTFLNV